jgi:hypothetical protein
MHTLEPEPLCILV